MRILVTFCAYHTHIINSILHESESKSGLTCHIVQHNLQCINLELPIIQTGSDFAYQAISFPPKLVNEDSRGKLNFRKPVLCIAEISFMLNILKDYNYEYIICILCNYPMLLWIYYMYIL